MGATSFVNVTGVWVSAAHAETRPTKMPAVASAVEESLCRIESMFQLLVDAIASHLLNWIMRVRVIFASVRVNRRIWPHALPFEP
jgi:hypothetical protein